MTNEQSFGNCRKWLEKVQLQVAGAFLPGRSCGCPVLPAAPLLFKLKSTRSLHSWLWVQKGVPWALRVMVWPVHRNLSKYPHTSESVK